ncbi:P-loop NTPase fold protein [Streptomyces canus]|uniref:P-loop NTPase fold protein n=1 Tax=Streptomyces canus TaxID=58343 RepID=UPI0033AED88D
MADGEYQWASEPEKALYRQAVKACLDNEELRDLLPVEATALREAVAEAMCSSPYVDDVLGSGAPRPRHSRYRRSRRLSDLYLWALPAPLSLSGIRENSAFHVWKSGAFLGWSVTLVGVLEVGVPLGLVLPLLFVVAPALALARQVAPSTPDVPVWFRSGSCLLLGPATFMLWCVESLCGALWITELERKELWSQVELSARRLIREGGIPLLVTGSHEGLQSLQYGPKLIVERESQRELRARMDGLTDGTIALSGPRGVGKTTLMRGCRRQGDFTVFAHAPAVYASTEFLTSLFVLVCREYIHQAGHRVPDLVRLSYLHRVRRRVLASLRRLLPPLPHALTAWALIGVGMFAATRQAIVAEHGVWGGHQLVSAYSGVSDFFAGVLHGDDPVAAMAVVLAGGALLALRHFRSFVRLVRGTCVTLLVLVTAGLLMGPFISFFFDPGVRHHFSELPDGQGPSAVVSLVLLFFFWCMYVTWSTSPANIRRRGRTWGRTAPWTQWGDMAGALLPFGLLALVLALAPLRPLLTDDETPFRIGAFLLGLLLARQMETPPRLRIATKLVSDCRDQLYRLQTLQSSSAALSAGASQLLTLGTSHTGVLTSVPPNPPMLVEEFRDLLRRIAKDQHTRRYRVVIAIDEIDRLGTAKEALAFLADIKAILGVPRVHYLLAVAEDVGAAFLRRGLPHRDVTDSSLDDVLHVPPCVFEESAEILRRRLRLIDYPYIALAHGLSGGIPRDLIRCARRLVSIRRHTEPFPDVTRTLVIEDLSQTFLGFRTLLAKGQETTRTVAALDAFHSLGAHLQAVRERPETADQLRGALALFARYEVDGLPEESRRLVEEAGAYAYFCLTLLDIFGRPDDEGRLTEAGHREGHLELLATARQELSVSPHSARAVLDTVRRAWRLDQLSGQAPVRVIPPPRTGPARQHGPTS